jgi:DNA-binding CsgD family transcriptional regulator
VTQIRERDFRAALDFLGEVYDCDDREEFRAAMLPGLRRLVPAEHFSYNEIAEVLAAIVEPELPGWAGPVWKAHAGENPILRRYLRTRDGRTMRFSDVMAQKEFRATPLFENFYRPLGIDHQIAFILPSTPELTVAVALSRGRRDFDERDRGLMELTRPHLIQAYRAAALRESLRATVSGMRSWIDAEGTAMVLLGDDGTVRFCSAAAALLIEESFASTLEAGRPLPEPLADWMGTGQPEGSIPLAAREGSLLLRRLRSDGRTVLILDDAGRVLSKEALVEFGLTPREAAVLNELGQGRGTDEAARALGIRPRTVAKHMQAVHAKLGVTSRAQAVATAWAAAGTRASVDR